MASAVVLGVPAERLVYGDLVEQVFWSAVMAQVAEYDVNRRDNQAILTANKIGEMLRRMFGGRRRR